MADPPSSRRPGSSPDLRSSSPDSEHRGPPSEPKILAAKPAAEADRAPRIQLVAALLLLLVLVVVPLYLWRRPRVVPTDADDAATPASLASVPVLAALGDAAALPLGADAEAPRSREGISVSEPKMLECHDPGPKHTAAADCDHLPAFEHALIEALLENVACAAGGGGGDIVWIADASFQRKKAPIQLLAAKDGRTIKNPKVVATCLAAVKKSLANVQLDLLDKSHAHARYKLELTATYK